MFSLFKNSADTRSIRTVDLAYIHQGIIAGAHGLDEITQTCNQLAVGDKNVYRKYKSENLPCITFAGTFHPYKRKSNGLKQHAGYVVVDLDDFKSTVAVADMIVEIKDNPAIKMIFTSPSGLGLKVIMPIDPLPSNADEHKAAWTACAEPFEELIGIHDFILDTGGTDLPRLCYLCHDPRAILREKAIPTSWTLPEPKPKPKTTVRYNGDIDITALDFISPNCDYHDWLTVGMGCHDAGVPFEVWDAWSSKGAKYNATEMSTKWESFKGTGITWSSVVYLARQGGYQIPIEDTTWAGYYKTPSRVGMYRKRRHI